jgi:acyl transferase domain-containing protein
VAWPAGRAEREWKELSQWCVFLTGCRARMAKALASHWRIAVSGRDLPELIKVLEDPVKAAVSYAHNPPKVGFIFNWQGAQWHTMGRELTGGAYPPFRLRW